MRKSLKLIRKYGIEEKVESIPLEGESRPEEKEKKKALSIQADILA